MAAFAPRSPSGYSGSDGLGEALLEATSRRVITAGVPGMAARDPAQALAEPLPTRTS